MWVTGCGSAIAPEATTDDPAAPAIAEAEATVERAAEAEPTESPVGPPPAVRVFIETDPQGHASLVVRVEGSEEVSLQRAIIPARDQRTEPAASAVGFLGAMCNTPEPCIRLVPGAEVRPPALSDLGGDRCGCETCPELGAGSRLIIRTCDGAHAIPSPALP